MSYILLNKQELRHFQETYTFEGYQHGDTHVSFFLVDMPPGSGPRLHAHPYEEVFILQEGEATFTVDSTTLEVKAGQIVIVPPNTPHKFVNSGQDSLRLVTIQATERMVTTWLED